MEEEEPSSCDAEVEEPAYVAGMASIVPVGRRHASLQRSAEKPASVTAETCPVPVPVGRRRASRQRSAEKPADVTMASPTRGTDKRPRDKRPPDKRSQTKGHKTKGHGTKGHRT